MASSTDFVQFITDQCSGAGEITARKMFGDYAIYCDGKIFGLVCDDRFYLKPTHAGRSLLRQVELLPPYEGAKDYFYIADVDDRDYLAQLVSETCKALPHPKPRKKRAILTILLVLIASLAGAQNQQVLDQLKNDPMKAYGTDYPYQLVEHPQTKAPKGYKPFYISHYSRHGSRYYWTDHLYKELDTLMTVAHNHYQLTDAGEAFYKKFMAAKQELKTGVSELTQLGWEQHQGIARIMYNTFPDVFRKGGDVLAISSLSGRCVLSMSAFCQELVQCNPDIEIREQSSRFTLDGVVPTDRQNPAWRKFPSSKPRYESRRDEFKGGNPIGENVVNRVFISTDSLPLSRRRIGSSLLNLYTSLPSIGHKGMMEGIVSDQEIASQWEEANLGGYSWVFGPRYEMIPILQDIVHKAADVIEGRSTRRADLRFGHDTCIGPLTVLMGINGADRDPEDPYQVKYCYQNWQTGMASNIQIIFYRKKGTDPVLVKCLLNGAEATLPLPSQQAPYYKWTDFRDFYLKRCQLQ